MDNEKKIPAGGGPAPAPDGVTIFPAPAAENAEAPAALADKAETANVVETVRRQMEEDTARAKEALEVMKEGKGVLELEKPIKSREQDVTKLAYDFTVLTGMDYTDAMDGDSRGNTQKLYGITYRQALNLFAAAAVKENPGMDTTDIITMIGGTDAAAAVQLATLFFTASIRAGRKRISRK